jgi:hypothetical protein
MTALRKAIFFVLFAAVCSGAAAQATEYRPRKFDEKKLEQLKNNSELQYKQIPEAISLWKRLLLWLQQLINQMVYAATTTDWLRLLILVLFIGTLLFIVLRILHIDSLKIFYHNRAVPSAQALPEDIHHTDFDAQLRDALAQHDYRLAIRIRFLQTLKLLSDNRLIHWKPGKTTHEYLAELYHTNLRPVLEQINYYYEYTWYGNFTASPDVYQKVSAAYDTCRQHAIKT